VAPRESQRRGQVCVERQPPTEPAGTDRVHAARSARSGSQQIGICPTTITSTGSRWPRRTRRATSRELLVGLDAIRWSDSGRSHVDRAITGHGVDDREGYFGPPDRRSHLEVVLGPFQSSGPGEQLTDDLDGSFSICWRPRQPSAKRPPTKCSLRYHRCPPRA